MRRSLALAVVAAVILAACGSSSSGGTKTAASTPSGPTKAQYIAQVNPICAAAKKRAPTKRILTLIGQFPTPTAEIARLLRQTVQIVDQVHAKLLAIPPPPADKAAISRWIGQAAAIGAMLSKAAGQVESGDLVGAATSEGDINAATVDPTTFARTYGLGDCASIGA